MLHIKSTGDATFVIEADSDDANENDLPLIHMKQDGGKVFHTIGASSNHLKIENGTTNNGSGYDIFFKTGGGGGPN